MFELAILIGIYSYLVLALGLLGILYKQNIILLTLFYIVAIVFFVSRRPPRRSAIGHLRGVWGRISPRRSHGFSLDFARDQPATIRGVTKLKIVLISILVLQAIVNIIGALGPELGFDALWYHLTLPKLYLDNHSIFYIPGGLLYYSVMPKLTEMLYVTALALNGEILAKFVHLSFGILTCIALFRLSREFLSVGASLLAVVIFYSNLVVGWQSITAYVDLARTFFEVMALWGFVYFWKQGERKWLIESAVMMGLAISTKLLAVGSLLIFSVLIVVHNFTSKESRSLPRHHSRWNIPTGLFVYWIICLLIPLPWFVFSYIHTGTPIYPFFTDLYKVSFDLGLINPIKFITDMWVIFTQAADPISPVYIIFLPLVILFFFRHLRDSGSSTRMTILKIISIYSFLALVIWYFTPRTGGGRFILPYLPALSIVVAGIVDKMRIYSSRKRSELRSFKVLNFAGTINFRSWCFGLVILVAITSILYRGAANVKYIPVIIGKQTKADFLSSNLNFTFGDFYDTDGYLNKIIRKEDKVLLYGFHNLYYVNLPFIDSTWVKKGDSFNFIATQHAYLPRRFNNWNLVYLNSKTEVKVYSKGGIKWAY